MTIPTFKGYAWLSVFHVPFKSGHSGKCGVNAPPPETDIPAHDTCWLDWESVKDTIEDVKEYAKQWHEWGDGYIVAIEVAPQIVDRVEFPGDEPEELPAATEQLLF